ncbi:MAG: SDR family oxidoreductase [Myxococcales bacterium]|nr:SDR family oxidoreductase [Myxococcales bacterium]
MQVAITGASGLLGANVAILLLQQGIRVRCTRRGTSAVQHLAEFPIEWVSADLEDREGLRQAFSGCDAVFHCAAAISYRRRPTPDITRTNVDGTRNVIAAIRAAGEGQTVPRLVHCSSVVTCAISTDGQPVDESKPWNFADFGVDEAYSITKRQAEEVVLAEVARGLDAVIVNPGYLLGPYDARPSSGRMIIQVIRRAAPGAPTGGNCFVDVRDVARGMIAAWQRGRRGERYILGGHNLPYRELWALISKVAGTRPLSWAIPRPLALPVGWLGDLSQAITGRESEINSVTVRYGYLDGYRFTSAKAERELGYHIGPLEPAIRDAITWFQAHKMLPSRLC